MQLLTVEMQIPNSVRLAWYYDKHVYVINTCALYLLLSNVSVLPKVRFKIIVDVFYMYTYEIMSAADLKKIETQNKSVFKIIS